MGNKSSVSREKTPAPDSSPSRAEGCDEQEPPDKAPRDDELLAFAPAPEPWPHERFRIRDTLQTCPRNHGKILLLEDLSKGNCAVAKQMPVSWTAMDVSTFLSKHPDSVEVPWMDIGLTLWLNDRSFPNCVEALGVFHENRSVLSFVMGYADGGDLYSFMQDSELPEPGPKREEFWLPLVVELMQAISTLHSYGIAHCDLSLENVLISHTGPKLRIIDYGMATTSRLRSRTPGKPSYTAPEVYIGKFDPFKVDSFACGVILYSMSVSDYPWLSTKPGGCQLFEHFKRNGFRAHIQKRRLRGSAPKKFVANVFSEPLLILLEALLNFNPEARTSIGGSANDKNSTWSYSWLQQLAPKDPEPHAGTGSGPTHPSANADEAVAPEPVQEVAPTDPEPHTGTGSGPAQPPAHADEKTVAPETVQEIPMNPQVSAESVHGSLEWNEQLSHELQESVDNIFQDNIWKLNFSVTIADPMQPDCPIVAMSTGFADLTGYQVSDVIGRNCRFLLDGVPRGHIDNVMRRKVRLFCRVSDDGAIAPSEDSKPDVAAKLGMRTLPKDEAFCVQANARMTGELFQNMFYLKHVKLNDAPFIIGLQAEYADDLGMQDSYHLLSDNMTKIEQALASKFWYSASIRRQSRASRMEPSASK